MNRVIKKIIGLVPVDIEVDEENIKMTFESGERAHWCHHQDCCESVEIVDIIGDFQDLIGHPLLVAEERTDCDEPSPHAYSESYTWTFYTFRNIGGSVDVRWLGESNGYYSESVDMYFCESQEDFDKGNWKAEYLFGREND